MHMFKLTSAISSGGDLCTLYSQNIKEGSTHYLNTNGNDQCAVRKPKCVVINRHKEAVPLTFFPPAVLPEESLTLHTDHNGPTAYDLHLITHVSPDLNGTHSHRISIPCPLFHL